MNPFVLRRKLRSQRSPDSAPEGVPLLASPAEQLVPEPPPVRLYEQTRQSAIGYGEELVQVVLRNLREGELPDDHESVWEYLSFYTGVVHTAKAAMDQATAAAFPPAPREAAPTVPAFVVTAKFLADCHAFLTSQPNGHERLHLVSGARLSPARRTLDYMAKVALSAQSETGAVASDHSLKQALLEFDTWGMALYSLFHSHPGEGAGHTRPSSIDLETHERYERRYPLVGCIFVRDGYLRFFRHSSEPFTITICGTGITTISEDEHVFKIQHPTRPPRRVSYDPLATQEEG